MRFLNLGMILTASWGLVFSDARAQCDAGAPLSGALSFASRGGTATLCGFSEFSNPSVPPAKYRRKDFGGQRNYQRCYVGDLPGGPWITGDVSTASGYAEYGKGACSIICAGVQITGTNVQTNLCDVQLSLYDIPSATKTVRTIPHHYGSVVSYGQANGVTYYRILGAFTETLSVLDTEDDAIARVTYVTNGTGRVAYREARGAGDFDFGFSDVTVTATFAACPGEYLITYRYGKRLRGSNGPWQTYDKSGGLKRFAKSLEVFTARIDVPGKGDNYEYTITDVTATAASCHATIAGNGSGGLSGMGFSSSGVNFNFNLGPINALDGGGALRLVLPGLDTGSSSSGLLEYAGANDSSVSVVRNVQGAILQVKTPRVLANIVPLSGTGEEGYAIEFYNSTQAGAADPVSGVFALSGSAFTSHRIENPDAGEVVESRRIRITEDVGASEKVTEYIHDSTNASWTMIDGGGLRVTEDTFVTLPNGDKVRTRILKTSTEEIASVVSITYRSFPWGEERIQESRDPSGANLSTFYTYYENTGDGINYRHLKSRVDPSGYWERYTYHADGRVATTTSPHLDAASNAPASQLRVTTLLLDTLPDADGDGQNEKRETTTVTLLGQELSRSYVVEWTKPVILAGVEYERRSDIRCVVPQAAWSAGSNLVEQTLRHRSGAFAGKIRKQTHVDGTITLTNYTLESGGALTSVVKTGAPTVTGDDILSGRRTVTLTNLEGHLAGEDVYAVQEGFSDVLLTSWDGTVTDEFGRVERIEYSDGTYETRFYACCGLREERDRSGLVTIHDYDEVGRRETTTRAGVTIKSIYDAADRVRAIERYPEGQPASAMVISETDYDLADRVSATRDSAGRQTILTESHDLGARRSTFVTALPFDTAWPVSDRGVIAEVRAADGSALSRKGTASPAVRYVYGTSTLSDAGQWGYAAGQHFTYVTEIKLDAAGVDTAESFTTYFDALGRVVKVVYPGTPEVASRRFYDVQGRLARETDADGVQTLYEYDSLGELVRTVLDLNRDGLPTLVEPTPGVGADRISRATRTYLTRTEGTVEIPVERTVTEVWESDVSAAASTLSTTDRSMDGRRTWVAIPGASGDLVTQSVTTYGPAAGVSTEVTTFPDTSTQTRSYLNGRLQSETRRDSAEVQLSSVSYGYDEHGRPETVTDARTGTTTYGYYPASDDLFTVTTPDPDDSKNGAGYDAQTTHYRYDAAGRVDLVTLPDHTPASPSQVHTEYWPDGQVKRTWGSRTYPSAYTYDAQGRVKTLTTWQDFAGSTGAATTTWNYSPSRGWLISKLYHGGTGPAYDYLPSGRLKTRDWVRTVSPSGPRIRASYTYNNAGELWTITYNDATTATPTPTVTLTYDRRGRPATTADAAGLLTRAYEYGRLDDEIYSGSGLLAGQSLLRTQDDLQRLQTLAVGASSLGMPATGYTYDGASRLDTVTRGAYVATYGYLANSSLVESVTVREGATSRLAATRVYDKLNRLVSLGNVGGAATRSAAYAFDGANRRTRLTREGGAYWDYAYDALGQLTGAEKFSAAHAPVPGQAFAFAYDDIGNRETATTNGRVATYSPDLLNRYSERSVPGAVDVAGEARADAIVTVNQQPAQRLGGLFHAAVVADNSAAPNYVETTVVGVKNLVGPNDEDAVTQVTRRAFLAKTPEVFAHDADGNLTADGRWSYQWDAENRLIAMETLPAVAAPAGPLPANERRRLEFAYDGLGRRIRKVVKIWNGAAYVAASDTRSLYDGWNLVAELDYTTLPAPGAVLRTHVWGLDISGSSQGAGGVGGLLWTSLSTGSCAAAYDGNGNVLAWYDLASGGLSGEAEYGPFGEVLKNTAPAGLPFGFSTKYRDVETGLNYYGFRYYNPSTGRWPSRDPIGERGGLNLYGMVNNNPVNHWDYLGLTIKWEGADGGTVAQGYLDAGGKDLNLHRQLQSRNGFRVWWEGDVPSCKTPGKTGTIVLMQWITHDQKYLFGAVTIVPPYTPDANASHRVEQCPGGGDVCRVPGYLDKNESGIGGTPAPGTGGYYDSPTISARIMVQAYLRCECEDDRLLESETIRFNYQSSRALDLLLR